MRKKVISIFLCLVSLSVYAVAGNNDTIASVNNIKTDKMNFNRPQIDATFEKIDIEQVKEKAATIKGAVGKSIIFNEQDKPVGHEKYYSYDEKNDSTYFYVRGTETSGFKTEEIGNDSYFMLRKVYYPNGDIKSKSIFFNSAIGMDQFHVGTEYRYDTDRNLNYAVNHDKNTKFSIEQVIQYLLEQEKLELPRGYLSSKRPINGIQLIYENNRYLWRIYWEVSYSIDDDRAVNLLLNANTGVVVSRTERKVNRIHN